MYKKIRTGRHDMGAFPAGRSYLKNMRRQIIQLPEFKIEALLRPGLLVGQDKSAYLVDGVVYTSRGAVTDSLVMRGKSGTLRWVKARHTFDKLMTYSAIEYD
jgi:hypothetical protein